MSSNGLDSQGREVYGSVGAPGNDPSVITVGAANFKGTLPRGDDTVTNFSSRGPTRGTAIDANGRLQRDNLLKPDLVAPGNKLVGAAAYTGTGGWNTLAATYYADLVGSVGINQYVNETVMSLSGTSSAAPVVAGAAAVLLQANPGLTPPLIKAILQYTAQPQASTSLLQQGAGLLNLEGAMRLARALRTDIGSQVKAGTISSGASMRVSDATAMPTTSSTVNGVSFHWSRIVFAGGNHVLSGSHLFAKYQPIWDPTITWAGGVVRRTTISCWSGLGISSGTYPKTFSEASISSQSLAASGVLSANSLAGASSFIGRTGTFVSAATLSSWLVGGSGITARQRPGDERRPGDE